MEAGQDTGIKSSSHRAASTSWTEEIKSDAPSREMLPGPTLALPFWL